MKKMLKIIAFPFVLIFYIGRAAISGIISFIMSLITLPITLAKSHTAPVDGHDYEHRVADYLRRRGYYGVSVTKASGDYGADVIARKGTKKYAVQCKYYSSPVGVAAVQEVTAAKAHYGCNAAMVVTNSTFTSAAEKLAAENRVILLSGVSGVRVKKKKAVKEKSAAHSEATQDEVVTPTVDPNMEAVSLFTCANCTTVKNAIRRHDPELLFSDDNTSDIVKLPSISASVLQRRFKIGCARADRIINGLLEDGLVEYREMNGGQLLYGWTEKAISQNVETWNR